MHYGNGNVGIVGIMVMVMLVSWYYSHDNVGIMLMVVWYRGHYGNGNVVIMGIMVMVMLVSFRIMVIAMFVMIVLLE